MLQAGLCKIDLIAFQIVSPWRIIILWLKCLRHVSSPLLLHGIGPDEPSITVGQAENDDRQSAEIILEVPLYSLYWIKTKHGSSAERCEDTSPLYWDTRKVKRIR